MHSFCMLWKIPLQSQNPLWLLARTNHSGWVCWKKGKADTLTLKPMTIYCKAKVWSVTYLIAYTITIAYTWFCMALLWFCNVISLQYASMILCNLFFSGIEEMIMNFIHLRVEKDILNFFSFHDSLFNHLGNIFFIILQPLSLFFIYLVLYMFLSE